jgi:hypothetical protein
MNRQLSKEEVQMDNRYMKKCSTSLATKEMQTKMSLRFSLIPVNNTKTNAGEDVCVAEGRTSYALLVGNVN